MQQYFTHTFIKVMYFRPYKTSGLYIKWCYWCLYLRRSYNILCSGHTGIELVGCLGAPPEAIEDCKATHYVQLLHSRYAVIRQFLLRQVQQPQLHCPWHQLQGWHKLRDIMSHVGGSTNYKLEHISYSIPLSFIPIPMTSNATVKLHISCVHPYLWPSSQVPHYLIS
jgi:hypothetical protein